MWNTSEEMYLVRAFFCLCANLQQTMAKVWEKGEQWECLKRKSWSWPLVGMDDTPTRLANTARMASIISSLYIGLYSSCVCGFLILIQWLISNTCSVPPPKWRHIETETEVTQYLWSPKCHIPPHLPSLNHKEKGRLVPMSALFAPSMVVTSTTTFHWGKYLYFDWRKWSMRYCCICSYSVGVKYKN